MDYWLGWKRNYCTSLIHYSFRTIEKDVNVNIIIAINRLQKKKTGIFLGIANNQSSHVFAHKAKKICR